MVIQKFAGFDILYNADDAFIEHSFSLKHKGL